VLLAVSDIVTVEVLLAFSAQYATMTSPPVLDIVTVTAVAEVTVFV
jgi:hypothetical protein